MNQEAVLTVDTLTNDIFSFTISNGITYTGMHLLWQSTCALPSGPVQSVPMFIWPLKQQIIEWIQWCNGKMLRFSSHRTHLEPKIITKQIQLFRTMIRNGVMYFLHFFRRSASILFLRTGHTRQSHKYRCSDTERATIIHIIRCCCCCCCRTTKVGYKPKVDTQKRGKLNSLKRAMSWWVRATKLCGNKALDISVKLYASSQ